MEIENACPASHPGAKGTGKYVVGKRYLHGKSGRPVTLRYIGPLPLTGAPSSSSVETTIWLGIEYDTPSYGKHSGTYQGEKVFDVEEEGAGAFAKHSPGVLKLGPTLVDALEERYGAVVPSVQDDQHVKSDLADKVALGTSGIVVDAPGLSAVQARIGRLERLREIGLDYQWVTSLGGTAEQREAMRIRMKGVHTLDLTGNLLSGFQEVADIVRHLSGLKTLLLSSSRIACLPVDIQDAILQQLSSDFTAVEELHLGNAGASWAGVVSTVCAFPNLRALHLHDNTNIARLDAPLPLLPQLHTLNLSGCAVPAWTDIADILGRHSLAVKDSDSNERQGGITHLDISKTKITSIPPRSARLSPLRSVSSLVYYQARISQWADIDALETWTEGSLKSLRFSLAGVADDLDDESSPPSNSLPIDVFKISGKSRADRSMVIAKLSGLTMLNLTPISPAERRDAEIWYISQVEGRRDAAHWGRYDELKKKYGISAVTGTAAPARSSGLKSKMITIQLHLNEGTRDEMSILPSAPVTLLRKKITKRVGGKAATLWTVRPSGDDYEKVAEIQDGHDVAWWLNDGDTVLVEPDA